MTEDFRNSWVKALESMRREQEMKEQLINQLSGVIERYKSYKSGYVKSTIPVERISRLEEEMPEFAEETQEGFTKEEIKKMIVSMGNYLIQGLDLKRMESSVVMILFSIKVHKVDFSKCSGEALYEYAVEKDSLKEFVSPEFKKKAIVSAAAELTVEKGNISFNKAVSIILDKCRRGTFIDEQLAESEKDISRVCGIVTPLIDWYLKNEVDIISWISKD